MLRKIGTVFSWRSSPSPAVTNRPPISSFRATNEVFAAGAKRFRASHPDVAFDEPEDGSIDLTFVPSDAEVHHSA